MMLDGRPFEVIGVTPPEFFFTEVGRTFDVALPLCAEPLFRGAESGIGKADTWFLDMMGRLAPGWTAERAEAPLARRRSPVRSATSHPVRLSRTTPSARTYATRSSPNG